MHVLFACRTAVLLAGILVLGAGTCGWSADTPAAEPAVPLKDAPPNTWVKVCESKTGGRNSPLFVYVPGIKKFVLASGMQTTGGEPPRHYDTEEFDLASGKWINAYPPAMAAGRPESGPVGEDYSKAVEHMNSGGGGEIFYKDGALLRIGCGGQWLSTKLNYEFTVVPETGKVYAYLFDKTICYDPVARTWQDLGAKPRTSCRIWGSMCYDPINKEILHAGGDGASWNVGTWALDIQSNAWRKLEFGSSKLKGLSAPARQLRWQAKILLAACCNRFAISETEAEAKSDLVAQSTALASAADKFAKEITKAGLTGTDKAAGEVAIQRLASAAAALQAAGPGLSERIVPEKIAAVRAIRAIFEQVADALAVEPPGRARSQIAYDPAHRKIVLFGGDQLDRVLSDTWLYDCATRTWAQKFPEKGPAPRAGHVLAWLPKAGQIVLAGGYSRVDIPHEIWSYDVSANVWKLLLHIPLLPAREGNPVVHSPNAPRNAPLPCGWGPCVQVGAVDGDDVLVCPSLPPGWYENSLITWACKVDPSKAAETGTATNASASGSYTFNRIDPATWEKAAKPDPEKTRQFLANLPTNQWTELPFPRYAPGAQNRWGTAAYDITRHQFLFWSGGHSTSVENDVSHFSVRGGLWTVGYHPDDPIEITYASVPTPFSFNDRPHLPMHTYHSYAYDSSADKMFYANRAYNPAAREWESAAMTGLPPVGFGCDTLLISSPHGVVCFSGKPPFIFDAKASQWKALPWEGDSPRFGSCDAGGGTYDYKRDCLWVSTGNGFFKYNFKAGKGEALKGVKPRISHYDGVKLVFSREVVHVPDVDLFLVGCDGLAWNPVDLKYYQVELPAMVDGKPVAKLAGDVCDGLVYDPELKLVLVNKNSMFKVFALKLDRATLKMKELTE